MKVVALLDSSREVMYTEPRLGPTQGCSAMPLAERWLHAHVSNDGRLNLLSADKTDDPYFGRRCLTLTLPTCSTPNRSAVRNSYASPIR